MVPILEPALDKPYIVHGQVRYAMRTPLVAFPPKAVDLQAGFTPVVCGCGSKLCSFRVTPSTLPQKQATIWWRAE